MDVETSDMEMGESWDAQRAVVSELETNKYNFKLQLVGICNSRGNIPLVTNHNVIQRSGDTERFRYTSFSLLRPPYRNVHHPNRVCTTNGDLQVVLENPLFRTLTQPKYSVLVRLFQDTSDAAGLALIIQMERMRVAEVIAARDTVVERLEDAYVSVRQKSATIDRLQRELDDLRRPSTPATSVTRDDDSSTQPPVQDIATFDTPQLAPREGDRNCQNTSAQVLPWQVPLVRWSILTGAELNR